MPKREIPAKKRGYLRIVDRMGKGAHSARGRDAARTHKRWELWGIGRVPPSSRCREPKQSRYSRCRGEKALAELPAVGRGPWQRQFRAKETKGRVKRGSPYQREWTLYCEL